MLRRQENLNFFMGEIEHALDGRPDGDDLVEEMLSLGSVVRLDDGTVADPTPPSQLTTGSGAPDPAHRPAPRDDRGDQGMKFGIFYEHQLPRPWTETSEQQLITDALDQIELADRLGIQYLWEVEHHFLEEYSHSSAPEVFLAAASQRTRRMRIGHGVVQTAPGYNHPARIAERIAMLDLVSNGRVEFGTGESSSEAELGGFGVDRDTKREAWLEGLEVAIRCMTETPFGGVDGRFVTMPPRNVVPKPVQKPHPPLWVACSRRDTILLAAEKGIGALSFAFVEPEDAKQWVDDYESVLARAVRPGRSGGQPPGGLRHPDDVRARTRTRRWPGARGGQLLRLLAGPLLRVRRPRPGHHRRLGGVPRAPGEDGATRPRRRWPPGTRPWGPRRPPATRPGCGGRSAPRPSSASSSRRYEEAGVDQLIFVMQAGHNRHEHIMESIELFGTEVLPEFVERDEAASRGQGGQVGAARRAGPGPPGAATTRSCRPTT